MRTFSKLFMTGLIALGMISCNKENSSINGNNDQVEDQVFFQFKLEVPQTRSNTEDGNGSGDSNSDAVADVEVGTKAESVVNNVQIILVNPKDNTVISTAKANFTGEQKTPGVTAEKNVYVIPFESKPLQEYAALDPDTPAPVNVIVYCNAEAKVAPGQKLEGKKLNVNAVQTDAKKIYAENAFIMTNANAFDYKCVLPLQKDFKLYEKKGGKAYPLGAIEVERLASRFDLVTDKAHTEFNIAGDSVKIVLTDVSMLNVNDRIYDFRRVSADGVNTVTEDSWAGLFGKEYGNYVVEPDDAVVTENVSPTWVAINTLNVADDWKDGMNSEPKPEYYRFRYGVENTMPASVVGTDNEMITATAIDFQAKIELTKECALSKGMKAGNNIYVFKGVLYGDWELVTAVVKNALNVNEETGELVNPHLAEVYDAWKVAEDLKAANPTGYTEETAAETAGFTCFKATDENGAKVYRLYYRYYNKHNTDESTKMNRYAVVRNNVYKLKVDKIANYGAPEWKPAIPGVIEDTDIFFQVSVRVLPWTVRVNNIEF